MVPCKYLCTPSVHKQGLTRLHGNYRLLFSLCFFVAGYAAALFFFALGHYWFM